MVLAELPSFPLGNTTSDFNGTIFLTRNLVNTSFRAQWTAAYTHSVPSKVSECVEVYVPVDIQ